MECLVALWKEAGCLLEGRWNPNNMTLAERNIFNKLNIRLEVTSRCIRKQLKLRTVETGLCSLIFLLLTDASCYLRVLNGGDRLFPFFFLTLQKLAGCRPFLLCLLLPAKPFIAFYATALLSYSGRSLRFFSSRHVVRFVRTPMLGLLLLFCTSALRNGRD